MNINACCEKSVTWINRYFRDQDESHKWPISGKFDATERAIRQARAFRKDYGTMSGYEYAVLLDQFLAAIVNNERNW